MKSLTETRVTRFLGVHMRLILSQRYSAFDNYIHKYQCWAITIFWSPFHRNDKSRHFLRYISFYRKIKHSWTELILGRMAIEAIDWQKWWQGSLMYISITHLIIIIKSEVSTFPIVVIFFRGCVSEMVVLSYSVIYYIYIPGTLGPCFHYWCSVYGICKWSDILWPVGRVRLFADYTISLSSLCRLIWKHWTTKIIVRYMMPSVCLRLRQFSQLSLYSLYGAVCLQLTQFSCDDRENVYFILLSSSNRKYESLTIV